MKKQIKVFMMMAMLALLVVIGGKNVKAADLTATVVTAEDTGANVPAQTYQILPEDTGVSVVPIQVTQAGVLTVETSGLSSGTITIFSYAADGGIGEILSYSEGTMVETYAATAGRYGFGVILDDMSANLSFTVKAYVKPLVKTDTLTNKQEVSGYGQKYEPDYYKITVPSSGLVKVTVKPANGGTATITCDTSKADDESDNVVFDKNEATFGVRKGTYYIGVDCDGSYKVSYTLTKVAEKKNYTSKKATTLKKGKKGTGVFASNDYDNNKGSRWYKITVPKTKKVKFELTRKGNLDESYYVAVSKKSGKKMKSVNGFEINENKAKGTKSIKLKKGTYYVEVSGGITLGSSFTLKWK